MTTVKQISVFLENKKGRVAELTRVLADHHIDLIALSISDTTEFGILRCIVSDTDAAVHASREAGFTTSTTQVLAVEVPDHPGGLAAVMDCLKAGEISVEYLYSFVRKTDENALIIFRVDDQERAISVLESSGVKLLSQEQVLQV